MELIKCPFCGEEYSPSYRSCPFCEEGDNRPARKHTAKRHITTRKKAQSARGGMIVVLVLVLALLGWYLFGDNLPRNDVVKDEPAVEASRPPKSGQAAEPAESAGEPSEPVEPTEPAETAKPAETKAHVDEKALGIKTNVSGLLPKDPGSGCFDCSVKKSDSIRLIVTGTDVEVSDWSSENSSVVSVDKDGKLTFNSTGTTRVTAEVGDAKVTCIVRVR